jgi:hypothetical protein
MVSKVYPKVGANSTLDSGARARQDKSLTAKQGLKNVNVAQGPRTGNAGNAEKRKDFQEDKKGASPLAKFINDAYAGRAMPPRANPKLEGVSPNNKPRRRDM